MMKNWQDDLKGNAEKMESGYHDASHVKIGEGLVKGRERVVYISFTTLIFQRIWFCVLT